jgi:hypothetical protein
MARQEDGLRMDDPPVVCIDLAARAAMEVPLQAKQGHMRRARGFLVIVSLLLLATVARAASSEAGQKPDGQRAKEPSVADSPPRSYTEMSGCLAKRAGPSRQKVAEPTRASGEIVVNHEIFRPCCLKGKVETKVSGDRVEVVEHLSGMPCRCECSSTLRTHVPLAPGAYHLEVWLDDRGSRERVTAKNLTVTVVAGKSRLVSLSKEREMMEAERRDLKL